MRTFDEYFEIFYVRHCKDKNFPIVYCFEPDSQEVIKQSILSMKDYFEDFWNEAVENAVNRKYEKRLEDLEEKIKNLEDGTYLRRNGIENF